MELAYFEKKARFVQKASVTGPGPLTVEAEVSFQVCNDEMCLFPEYIPLNLQSPSPKERSAHRRRPGRDGGSTESSRSATLPPWSQEASDERHRYDGPGSR